LEKKMNRPTGVAIVGARVGNRHAEGVAAISHQARIVAVCAKTEESARQFAEKWSVPVWTTHYAEVLERRDVEAVHLCTPHDLHAPMAIEAAQAGKHILCEKPIARSIPEAEEMIKAAKAAGVVLMISHNQRFVEGHWLARRAIADGLIGDVFLITAGFHHFVEVSGFRLSKERAGGGALLDSGLHWIDLFRWLVGEVESVGGYGGRFHNHTMESEDTAAITLRFCSGALGQLSCTWAARNRNPIEPMTICGAKGTLRIVNDKLSYEDRNEALTPDQFCERFPALKAERALFEGRTGRESVKLAVAHFIACIQEGKRPLITGEEGLKSLAVALAASKAIETHSFVQVERRGQ
jgi:predicted dehydrogenase